MSYFNSKNGLQIAMFKMVEQALGEMVESGPAFTASRAELLGLVQAASLDNEVFLSVLSNMEFNARLQKQ